MSLGPAEPQVQPEARARAVTPSPGISPPAPASETGLLRLQRAAGNRTVTRLVAGRRPATVQRLLQFDQSWASSGLFGLGGLVNKYYDVEGEKKKLSDALETLTAAVALLPTDEPTLAGRVTALQSWVATLEERPVAWSERATVGSDLAAKTKEATQLKEEIVAAKERTAARQRREEQARQDKQRKREAAEERQKRQAEDKAERERQAAAGKEQQRRELEAYEQLRQKEASEKAQKEQLAKEAKKEQDKRDLAVFAHFKSKHNKEKLGELRGKVADDAQLIRLLGRANEDDLRTLLGKASANDLETLLPSFPASDLEELLGLTTTAQLLAVAGRVAAARLKALLTTYKSYAVGLGGTPTAEELVDADASSGSWSKGTFPDAIRSILYHYKKHNIDEAGPAADVAAYTAAANQLWTAQSANAQVRADPVYGQVHFAGGHHRRGGYFTPAGQILTFWYQWRSRHDLVAALEALGATSLPPGSDDAELDEVHARLALYDARVAGVATSLLDGAPVDAAALQPDRELADAIAHLSDQPGRAAALAPYDDYRRRLDGLLELARDLTRA